MSKYGSDIDTVYLSIANQIKNEIATFEDGAKLSTEFEYMKRYSVSRGTVRHALEALENAGIIYKIRGLGTFKGKDPTNRAMYTKVLNLTESLTYASLKPSISNINLELVNADEKLAELLDCNVGDELWKMSRARGVDGKIKTIYAEGYILKTVIPNLKVEDLDLSLTDMIWNKFGVPYSRSTSIFEIEYETEEICKILGIEEQRPALLSTFIAYNKDGVAFLADFTYNMAKDYKHITRVQYTED